MFHVRNDSHVNEVRSQLGSKDTTFTYQMTWKGSTSQLMGLSCRGVISTLVSFLFGLKLIFYSIFLTANDIRKVGHINIPNLLKISLLKENLESLMPQTTIVPSGSSNNYPVKVNVSTNGPLMNSRTKIFELCGICDIAKVCLVYESPDLSNPKIYLLEKQNFKWQFLADTFTEYLRMTIAHLGLPYWELCFSSCGLPSWTEVGSFLFSWKSK